MNQRQFPASPYQPQIGCLLLLFALLFVACWVPIFLLEAAQIALEKLHLTAPIAVLVLFGILLGGLINIPVWFIERKVQQPLPTNPIYSLMGWTPGIEPQATQTVIAVNVGGCLIPLALAIFEFVLLLSAEAYVLWVLLIVVAANVAVCYFSARPIQGIGIAMPVFVSPLVSVLLTWLFLLSPENALIRAPVAFIAGVSGPLIGADLLHLRDITRFSATMLSIGGAGTFDGIVLSGLLAAFLA